MIENMTPVVASVIVAAILMVIHEFPKSLVYYISNKKTHKGLKHLFKLHHYIDPIGLLLFITSYAGFSKPYMCSNKDKKTNVIMGLLGFFSMIFVGLICFVLLILYIPYYNVLNQTLGYFIYCLLYFGAFFSFSMFVVNLIPVSTFDMAQVISGISPKKYYTFVKYDTVLKGIVFVIIMFRLVGTVGQILFSFI